MNTYSIYYNTKDIVEHLMFISSNIEHLKGVLEISSILNYNSNISFIRNWSPKNKNGEINLKDGFNNPIIFTIKSNIIGLFIINQIKNKRMYSMIKIIGNNSFYYQNISMTEILNQMNKIYNFNDENLPKSVYNQILIFPWIEKDKLTTNSNIEELNLINNINSIKNKNKFVKGAIFTEIGRNIWFLGEDFYIINKNKNKIINKSFKNIIKELFIKLL